MLSLMCKFVRILNSMLVLAAQRKRPRASEEFPAAVTAAPFSFCSSALGG